MKYLFFIVLVVVCQAAFAQNGKLLSRDLLTIAPATIKKAEATAPGATKNLHRVTVYKIAYLSEGLRVHGYLLEPKQKGKYPCVIYNRGGNRDDGMVDDSGLIVRGLIDICAAGYVVVASQYRGNDGGEGAEEFGGRDVHDVLSLIPLLSHLPRADTSRIGMFGWSRGGMMTYLAMKKTSRLKAAVIGSGLSDVKAWIKDREGIEMNVLAALIPNYAIKKEEALQQRSAIAFADSIHRSIPLLILHGSADWRVPASQALKLVKKLYELKHPFRFLLYEGGQHSLLEYRVEYIDEVVQWFHKYVRDGKRWPGIDVHGD